MIILFECVLSLIVHGIFFSEQWGVHLIGST